MSIKLVILSNHCIFCCMCECLVASVMSDSLNHIDCSPPGFSVHEDSPGQEYWSGLPCPAPGDLPNPRIKPRSPALQADSLPSESPGKPHHLLHPSPLPSVFPSIRVFSNESALHIRRQKWSFGFSISPSNEYSGLISFRIDWFDLLAVQGTLKSLCKHYSSKASILWCSAFFLVQLSHPCMTTGETIALTRWNFVGKVMSLLFNMLPRLVMAFLPSSKHLLISWVH